MTVVSCPKCEAAMEKHYSALGLVLCLGLCSFCCLGVLVAHLLRDDFCPRCHTVQFYSRKCRDEYLMYHMYDNPEKASSVFPSLANPLTTTTQVESKETHTKHA